VDEREQTSNPGVAEEILAGEPAVTVDAGIRPAAVPVPPSFVDGEEHPVDPRTVKISRIIGLSVSLLIAMVLLIGFTVGWVLDGISGAVYLSLLGGVLLPLTLVLLFNYVWSAAHHRHLRYRVDERGLRIRRGVIWRKVIWIPISRIQHTDVSQGPLQRSFALATLTVHTAGTEGASISLAGLEHGIATRLCDHLRPDRETDAS
jgi:membrane protein YdbS with pleckstrin-like domain